MKRRTQNATRVIYCFLRKSDSKYVFCDLLRLNTSSHPLHKTPNNTTPPHAPTSSQRMCTTSLCVPGSPYANWSQSPNLLNSAKLHKVFQNFVVPWKIDIKISKSNSIIRRTRRDASNGVSVRVANANLMTNGSFPPAVGIYPRPSKISIDMVTEVPLVTAGHAKICMRFSVSA